jgi:bifunctional non-homologous end joining protein LigD
MPCASPSRSRTPRASARMRRSSKKAAPLLAPSEPTVRSRLLRRHDPSQPDLPFDPMPERIEPCLALLQAKVPAEPDWLFEVKWDGYRLAVHIDRQDVSIITRGGHDWTHRFPSIAAAAMKIGVHTAILDGEAVVLDERGRSDFGACRDRSADVAGNEPRPSPSSWCLTCFILTGMTSPAPS